MTQIEQLTGGRAGEVVTLHPDLTLITNGFSHAVTEYVKSVKDPDKAIVVYDHNVPAGLPEESKVFEEILGLAKQYGIAFRQAKGIALKWLMECGRVKAGDIVIAGTRHASVFGAVGAMGIGVSETEMARILETGEYQMVVPETVSVKVTGELSEDAGWIDAALTFLAKNPDLEGKAIEFVCPALDSHAREVLCEMASDTGAVTAFASEDGEAERTLDLGAVVPMLRLPCDDLLAQKSAGFAKAADVHEPKINAGQIGGINGAGIEDLRKAAALMEGKKLKLGFRLSISPATSETYIRALDEGLITKFIDFNAQINAAGDHDIVPQGAGAMGPGEVLYTTGLYTYAGAMGSSDAKIYTASVETIMREAVEE